MTASPDPTPARSSGETGARRHLRLGPVRVQFDVAAFDRQVAGWLPYAIAANDASPAAVIAISDEPRPLVPLGAPAWSRGSVVAHITAPGRVLAVTASGHARLDLGGRLARVMPGDAIPAAHDLLTATCALLLAQSGVAMLDAAAVADGSGWGWLVVGRPDERDAVVRAFTADGGRSMSRRRVLLHRHPLSPDQLVVEGWQSAAAATMPAFEAAMAEMERGSSRPRWCPLAPLRGILVVSRTAAPVATAPAATAWRVADRSAVPRLLQDALVCDGVDPAIVPVIAELRDAASRRVAVHAPIDPAAPLGEVRATTLLRRALEDHFA